MFISRKKIVDIWVALVTIGDRKWILVAIGLANKN
jgi:hypothetical protein